MTGREWKPGDVAMSDQGVVLRCAFRGGPGWTYDDGSGRPGNYLGPLRPLVVIDPEDREAVARLTRIFMDDHDSGDETFDMQAALREFANPKPRIEEPAGLGAVVEDGQGHRWVRWKVMERRPWRRDYGVDPDGQGGTYAYWQDIDAVRVLSEGVQP